MATNYEFVDDEAMPSCSVKSTWRTVASTAAVTTQTVPLQFQIAATQTATFRESSIQTDEAEERVGDEAALSFDGWSPDRAVTDFLARVEPQMSAQLARNASSHAFADFNPYSTDDMEEGAKLYTLTASFVQPSDETSAAPKPAGKAGAATAAGAPAVVETFPCTGASWGATGSVLFASFGRLDHSGWCTHRAGLGAWNIFKKDFSGDKPNFILETSSCLMCVACHPTMPSVVVGGTFNGEVIVWDTNNDEPLVASSKIDDYFHREAITQVSWFYDMYEKEYLIASSSGDGKILFWSLRNNLEYPLQGYMLTPAVKRKGDVKPKKVLVGGTALAFTHEGRLNSSFVVGSEGGGVYRSLLRNRASSAAAAAEVKTDLRWDEAALSAVIRMPQAERPKIVRHVERFAREKTTREVTLATVFGAKPDSAAMFPNPVDFKYQPHVGPVHALDSSHFHRNLFVSCGADGRVLLYSVLQTQPLLTLEPATTSGPLFAVAFSRVRPLVFAVAGADGTVYLYDLQQSTSGPVDELKADADSHIAGLSLASSVLSLSFNPKQRKLLAVGDSRGRVHVWRLGWRLSNEQPGEEAMLNKFLQTATAAE